MLQLVINALVFVNKRKLTSSLLYFIEKRSQSRDQKNESRHASLMEPKKIVARRVTISGKPSIQHAPIGNKCLSFCLRKKTNE